LTKIPIVQLSWYIYHDQYEWILHKTKNGMSQSELFRRILDYGIKSDFDFKNCKSGENRVKRKTFFNVLQEHAEWMGCNFPVRKKAEYLRRLIDLYIQEEIT
jgi:hypothetical protein